VPSVKPQINVSIIVAVRNEERNISTLLECLHHQDYPKDLYEIIIVDDHSTDSTWSILQSTDCTGMSSRFIQLAAADSTKKTAIAEGIRIAAGELILTTDADCILPSSWIRIIASFYASTGANFIACPVVMNAGKSFVGIFQSLDFLVLQGITGASVYKRFHTMCNGANLAYPKKAFEEVNGFEGIGSIPSGDDMLVMHKIYKRYPHKIFYLKNAGAMVVTGTEPSWKDFLNQRIRWASKALYYKDKRIFFVLLLAYLFNLCFIVLAAACFWNIHWLGFLAILFISKILIEFPFVNAVAIFFKQQGLMKFFPFLQPLHILYIVLSGWLGSFGSYKWKSRIIKN
jgi:cellulose synthase/poly-beta-1,6-N-acetylglucosamine synthase-like glycosyltransferase